MSRHLPVKEQPACQVAGRHGGIAFELGETTMRMKIVTAAAAAFACAIATPASAQQTGRAIISIYHAAPGHQIELLKWLANQDRAATAAGVGRAQLYVHTDGDSWDYLMIAPITTPEQDAAIEAAGRKLGIESGVRASIDLRKHIASHTDTFVRGPMSAAEVLSALGEK
jgi:hypothetical protein